jgi:hypothetical protein
MVQVRPVSLTIVTAGRRPCQEAPDVLCAWTPLAKHMPARRQRAASGRSEFEAIVLNPGKEVKRIPGPPNGHDPEYKPTQILNKFAAAGQNRTSVSEMSSQRCLPKPARFCGSATIWVPRLA